MECAKHIKATRDWLILEENKKRKNMEGNPNIDNIEEKETIPSNHETEEEKPTAVIDIFEWHSQQQGVDWRELAAQQEQMPILVKELTKRMPSSQSSIDEAIECDVDVEECSKVNKIPEITVVKLLL